MKIFYNFKFCSKMKTSIMSLLALKLAVIICLGFCAGAASTVFEIAVYPTYLDSDSTNISFNDDTLIRFRNCLCNNLTDRCSAEMNCSNKICKVSNISNSTLQDTSRVYILYHCSLKETALTKKLFCRRLSYLSYNNDAALFYTTYASACQLNCVEIIWQRGQFAEINYRLTDKIESGSAPTTCSTPSFASAVTTTTPTTTHPTPKVTTSLTAIKQQISVSATSTKNSFTTELKTGKFNGDNDDSVDNVPIIIGVIIILFALLVIGVGLFLLRRRRHKHAPTRQKSQKESLTVSTESKFDNFINNESSSYSNIASDNQGYTIDAIKNNKMGNNETKNEYNVNYSNGEFYYANSEQPDFLCQAPQQSNSNAYLNSDQVQHSGENGISLIESNVADPEYSSIDQNQKETTYSNTDPLAVDSSQLEQMETYLNVSKKQNRFPGENCSAIINDYRPTYYELEATESNPYSEKQAISEINNTPVTTVNDMYSKLGDQSRQFKNPYNSLTGKIDSVTVSNFDVSTEIDQSNMSSEYSLASMLHKTVR